MDWGKQQKGAAGAAQAIGDMVRIIGNGMTFGGADKLASALTGKDAAAMTAASRGRTGLAGDIASVGGIAGGIKSLPAVARTIWANKGKAAAAGAVGLGTLVEYNARTGTDTPAAPKAKAAKQPDVDAMVGKITSALQGAQAAQVDAKPTTYFDEMIQRVAEGQGGVISLRQLGALSEAAQRGAAANAAGSKGKTAKPGDQAAAMLESMYIQQLEGALGNPKADPKTAQDEFEEKVLQLRKSQLIDPFNMSGADGGGE